MFSGSIINDSGSTIDDSRSIIDDSGVTLQLVTSFMFLVFYRHIFIVLATGDIVTNFYS